MVDITLKHTSLRYAKAQAIVTLGSRSAIDAVVNKCVPKGDVFEFAKVAALFAVKKTYEIIPDCHPLPVESTKVSYEIVDQKIIIYVEVKCIYRTGVEVEAMHGASVAALTIYDMLKPIDKNIEINSIKLLEKTGGKSNEINSEKSFSCNIILYSDSIFEGKKDDKISPIIKEVLSNVGIEVNQIFTSKEELGFLESYLDRNINDQNFLLICGGTGITPKDIVPRFLQNKYHVAAESLMHAARQYGFERDFKASLSNSTAGIIENCLVMAIPGSENGAIETIRSISKIISKVLSNIEKTGRASNL